MISIAQGHYNYLLQLVNLLHKNFNLLLNEKQKYVFVELKQEFTKINNSLIEISRQFESRSGEQRVILVQLEEQTLIMKQKSQRSLEQIKKKQQQIARQRVQLNRLQKQLLKYKQQYKLTKSQLLAKSTILKQTQQQFKQQLKQIKTKYRQQNKQLKLKVKSLQKLLQTAMMSANNHQQIQNQLDKQLQQLRKYQQLQPFSAPNL